MARKEIRIAPAENVISARAKAAGAVIGNEAWKAAEEAAIVNMEASVFEVGDEFDIPNMDDVKKLIIAQGKSFYIPVVLKNGAVKQFYFNSLKKSVPVYHEVNGNYEIVRENGRAKVVKPTSEDGMKTYNAAMAQPTMGALIQSVAGKHVSVVEKQTDIDGPKMEQDANGRWSVVGISKTNVMGFKLS